MKIAIIIHRYSSEMAGGSEHLCHITARMLSVEHEITVITTCAKNYITWDNFYDPGESLSENIRVLRFRTERSRDIDKFNEYSDNFFRKEVHTEEEEREWIDMQGPYVPELVEYIKANRDEYDIFIFFTYLYYPVVYGLMHAKNCILVPTFHPELPASLTIYRDALSLAQGYVFNSFEEVQAFKDYGFLKTDNYIVAGMPVDFMIRHNLKRPHNNQHQHETPSPAIDPERTRYFLYSGRIDRQKGFFDILSYHTKLTKNNVLSKEKLIVTGSGEFEPEDESVIYLGFVSEALKYRLIKSAIAVLVPSYMESLSIIALESLYYGIPIIGRESCAPVRGHIQRGNGGLLFSDFDTYRKAVVTLLSDRFIRRSLGSEGREYIIKNYSHEAVYNKYIDLLRRTLG